MRFSSMAWSRNIYINIVVLGAPFCPDICLAAVELLSGRRAAPGFGQSGFLLVHLPCSVILSTLSFFWAPWVSSAQTCSHCPILLRFEASSRSSQNHLQHCSKHLCWAYIVLILWSYVLEFDEFRCSSSSQCPLFSAAGEGSVVTEPQISWGLNFVWDVTVGCQGNEALPVLGARTSHSCLTAGLISLTSHMLFALQPVVVPSTAQRWKQPNNVRDEPS